MNIRSDALTMSSRWHSATPHVSNILPSKMTFPKLEEKIEHQKDNTTWIIGVVTIAAILGLVIIMNIGIYLDQKRKRSPDCEKKVEDVEKSE